LHRNVWLRKDTGPADEFLGEGVGWGSVCDHGFRAMGMAAKVVGHRNTLRLDFTALGFCMRAGKEYN
jgi:hypothetical protein